MGIAVLGPLSLDGYDAVLGRRDRVVLSALAVHPGQVVSFDRLVDVLWGDAPPPSAAKVLQGCVVRLRKVLGPRAVETSPAGYRLMVPLHEIDSQRFERAVERARGLLADGAAERAAVVLTEALALWRGVPLVDLEGWDTARIEAGRLSELRLEADELYVEATLKAGHNDRVLAKAQAMVREAPLRERRWVLLARTQYQSGRQGDALRSLRRVRAVLGSELGLDPGPEIEQLEHAILKQDPSLVIAAAPDPDPACPYPGLLPYGISDAVVFFGREKDVTACLHRLRDFSVLAVVGPSGSGKSSLVRAGVAAALERDGNRVEIITPGPHPMNALATASSTRRSILVVDQCEEVFFLCQDQAERADFLSTLAGRGQAGDLILSLRADRLGEVAAYPDFARLVEKGLFLIGEMDEDDLREAIAGPARQAGLAVEPGLVDLLVSEVERQPGALPMLSHALSETWQRREGRTLTVTGYRDSGGIRGAVTKSAEDIYAQLDREQQSVLREMLLRLVPPGEDGEPVRARLPRRLVIADSAHDEIIDMLVSSRLVTSDDGVVELAHEALARAWPRLRGWLEEDIDGQRISHHLAIAADAWDALGRPDSELYRGVRLSTALDWRRRSNQTLSEVEQAFLEHGERVADAEVMAAAEHARHQSQVNRRLRGLLVAASALMVATLIAGLFAVRQASQAEDARRAAEDSRELADAAALAADSRRLGARALITRDISLSMLLAVQGVKLENSPESRANLTAALAKRPQLAGTTIGEEPPFVGAFGAEREEVASTVGAGSHFGSLAGANKRIPAWYGARWFLATSDGTNRVVFYDGLGEFLGARRVGERHNSGYDVSVVFRPDTFLLAVGMNTEDPAPVKLLSALTRRPVERQLRGFPEEPSAVVDLDFSANGRYLAGTFESSSRGRGSEEFALVWDVRRRHSPRTVALPSASNGLAVSPDGETIYTSWPLTAHDVSTGRRLWRSPLDGARHLDINDAGTLLAMPEWDDVKNNNVVLVDAQTGKLERRLYGHREQTGDVRFSPDGSVLASVSNDETVLLWDVRTGTVRDQLETGQVNAASFSPDGTKLVTSGEDTALRLWDLTGEARYIPRVGTGPRLTLLQASIRPSPDGRSLAYTWVSNGIYRLRFHDVVTDESGQTLDAGLSESIGAGAWRSDRERFATGGGNGVVRVWRPDTGKILEERKVGRSLITSLEYSHDGKRLVASETSGLVRVVDSETLLPLGTPVDLQGDACCITAGAERGVVFAFSDPSDGRENPALPPHTQWNLIDLNSGRVIRSRRLGLDVRDADVSPNGNLVAATGTGGAMLLLDARSGRPVRRPVDGHDADASGVRYSEDGANIATTATDGTVSLWDGQTGDLLQTVGLVDRVPLVAEFLYGDEQLLIASYSGDVYRWDTSRYWAISFACRLAGRRLTREEWQEYLGDRPYRPDCPVGPSGLQDPIF